MSQLYSTTNNPATVQNQVLRNTYALLAVSLIPTVAGAWLGLSTGMLQGLGPLVGVAVFLIGAMGLMFMVEKNKNSSAGLAWLMAFTFFMGVMLSNTLARVLGKGNGPELVATAFGATMAVFFAMAALSTVIKRDLSWLGKALFIGVILLIVASLANLFFQSSALMLTLSVLSAGIFSVFVLVDLKRVRDGLETNYISATLGVYLSLYNVFSSLLNILGFTSDSD
jgi:modulator of FtsH protease